MASPSPRCAALAGVRPSAHRAPALNGDPEDHSRDRDRDDRVGERQTERHQHGAQQDAEADDPVGSGVVAVSDEQGESLLRLPTDEQNRREPLAGCHPPQIRSDVRAVSRKQRQPTRPLGLHRLLFLWHGRLLRRGCLPPTQVLLGHASSSHVRYGTESAARRNRQGSSSRALSRESP